ncbi:MAG: hypothetical protein P4L99_15695 [Chthoniobacter sp.]|nr:hypothetical protein [Chthoniobacter sp.]
MSTRSSKEKKQEWPYVTWAEREQQWKVDGRTKEGGSRRFFDTKAEAETYAQQCRVQKENNGISAFGNVELAAFGKTVHDAIAFYLGYLRRQQRSVPVKDAIAAFLDRMSGRSARYTSDLRTRLGHFETVFGDQQIGSVEPAAITDWLDGMDVSPVTRNTIRRRVASFFAFAKEKKWRQDNPFAGGKKAEIKRVDEPRKKVRILTVEQVKALVDIASDETLPFWLIAIFAGLRPESEIFRLRWEHIDLEQKVIVVDGSEESDIEETKTGRRVVQMKDCLVAMLLPFARPAGPVIPPGNVWKKLRVDKRQVGFGTPGSETDEEKAAGMKLKPWVEDITRHTFGSHLLAACGDIGIVSTQMGNSPEMVRKHYLALVKPAEAAKFWAIKRATNGKVIPLVQKKKSA